MKIIIEGDPGDTGRAMANHIAARMREIFPSIEVEVVFKAKPREQVDHTAND